MAGLMAQKPSEHGNAKVVDSICMKEESRCIAKKWYFDRKEIECHSPSRKDGIDLKEESYLRKSYCSFLQELGMKLKVPQVTIATAVMICHRFYMGQSHAKNDWQTIATVGLFLACKIDDTPRFLNDLITLAYEMMYKWDPSAPKRIRQREYFSKQKELILIGERLFLSTIAFDLDIQLPYKPLIAALRKLGLFASLGKVAWNFVNDWIQTTLCLEYRPHYVAAGSLFLAAKFQKVKLPTEKGKGWWLEFDVSPKQLEEITQQMLGLLEQNTKQAPPPTKEPSVAQYKGFDEQTKGASPQSCISSVSTPNLEEARELGASEISSCSVLDFEDGETHFRKKESDPDQKSNLKCVSDHDSSNKIDLKRISDKVKRMKRERAAKRKVEEQLRGDNDDGEAWIERELESGIEIEYESSKKKHRIVL